MAAKILPDLNQVPQSLYEQNEEVERVEANEGQKVLVVPVAKAIVDERAMVVKKLHTSIADGAVKAGFTFNHFAVGA